VDIPFSTLVGGAGWGEHARAWVRERAAEAGLRLTGPIEQPRIRPWSTQLVAPTDRGLLWFKANCDALAFEPALHAVLAELEPDEVDEPLAVDADRGWILSRDRGTTLGEQRDATLADWRRLLATAAGMQRRLSGHGARLLATGLPDCSPGTVPGRFDEMVERLRELPVDHPSHLSAGRAAELVAGRGAVEEAAAALTAAPLPVSVQHGDLHPRNVFEVGGALRLFDFGDAQWAHPLEVLAVPYGWLTQLTQIRFADVVPAWCEAWGDVVSPSEMESLLPAAMVTHAVNRSWTWWGATEQATREELREWGDGPLHFLALALEPFPPTAVEQDS
jgi:hypothetical protein